MVYPMTPSSRGELFAGGVPIHQFILGGNAVWDWLLSASVSKDVVQDVAADLSPESGPFGVGLTTLVPSLLGLPFGPNYHSTRGIQVLLAVLARACISLKHLSIREILLRKAETDVKTDFQGDGILKVFNTPSTWSHHGKSGAQGQGDVKYR